MSYTVPTTSLRPKARPLTESLRPKLRPSERGLAAREEPEQPQQETEETSFWDYFDSFGGSTSEDDNTSPSERASRLYEEDAFSMALAKRPGIRESPLEYFLGPKEPEVFFAEPSPVTTTPLDIPTPAPAPAETADVETPAVVDTPTGAGLMSPRLDSKGETVPISTWQRALGKPIFNDGSFSKTMLSTAITNSGIETEESAVLRGAFETEVGNSGPITEGGYSAQNAISKGPNSAWGKRMVRDGVMNADGTLTDLFSADNLFNSVYSNSDTGNGDFASGDGSRFKGRGLIQITGRNNYQEVQNRLSAMGIEVDIMANPDLVNDEKYALPAALAFLDYAGINKSTIPTMSAKGLNNAINSKAPVATAEERWENVVELLEAEGKNALAESVKNRDEYAAQRTAGTTVDGSIGPNSRRAMRNWLSQNGVTIPENVTDLGLVILVNENS